MADRLIGYNTLGTIDYIQNPETGQNRRLYITNGVALNKYITPVAIKNPCFGVIYVDASEEWGNICRPVIFSDIDNFPGNKISKNEQSYNCRLNTSYLKGKYWLSTDFELEQPIPANTPIWFGFFAEHFPPRMDTTDTDYYIGYPANNTALNTPSVFPTNYQKNYVGKFKFSHYFYATIAQNNLKITVTETAAIQDNPNRYGNYIRLTADDVKVTDHYSFPALFQRSLPETAKAGDTVTQWRAYFRGILTEAASVAEASICGAHYCRTQIEMVQAAGMVFRGLLIFVKLLTTSFVRDFLIRRFLKSNEELVLKSAVCREIILESKIN